MPVSFTKVEKASSDLIESTKVLKEDPYSVDGRKLLINGARGKTKISKKIFLVLLVISSKFYF